MNIVDQHLFSLEQKTTDKEIIEFREREHLKTNVHLNKFPNFNCQDIANINKMITGTMFWKEFMTGNKAHFFYLTRNLKSIRWFSSKKKKKDSTIKLILIKNVTVKANKKYYFCGKSVYLTKLSIKLHSGKVIKLISFSETLVNLWASGLNFIKKMVLNIGLNSLQERVWSDIFYYRKNEWGINFKRSMAQEEVNSKKPCFICSKCISRAVKKRKTLQEPKNSFKNAKASLSKKSLTSHAPVFENFQYSANIDVDLSVRNTENRQINDSATDASATGTFKFQNNFSYKNNLTKSNEQPINASEINRASIKTRRYSDIFRKMESFCICNLFGDFEKASSKDSKSARKEFVNRNEFDLLEQQFSEIFLRIYQKHSAGGKGNENNPEPSFSKRVHLSSSNEQKELRKVIEKLKNDFFKNWFYGNFFLMDDGRDLRVFESMAKILVAFDKCKDVYAMSDFILFFNVYTTMLGSLKEKYLVLRKRRLSKK